MDFSDTKEEAVFREEVQAWIKGNAPEYLYEPLSTSGFGSTRTGDYDPLAEAKKWQKKKADAGWACIQWPSEYGGRGATPIQSVIWNQEEGVYGSLSRTFIIGQGMCAPTMMAYASEEQKQRYLPKLASGEEVWCQLFSEPHGGSDLAGLRTRAEKDGDDWVINGQKIWTSGAHYSDFGILITRTDPDVPKHKGLTMFFLDMRSEGVDIVPIKQANGDSGFNEVYFDNVRIPDVQRLGEVGEGWKVSLTTLMNERLAIGGSIATGFPEIKALVDELRVASGSAIEDSAVRSKLADWYAKSAGLQNTASRAISALSKGETPGPENSIGKLVAGGMMQDIAKFALDLQGLPGAIMDPEIASGSARLQAMLMRSPAVRIEGGTDQILRNIISERVLGLPEDMRADKGLPFNKIPTGN
ncbi:MAG: acyl-CoA dehydrogenase [Pseudomonadales bacterium]|nr:acyl-CoA dehydrogenase [Pseudomonadales bacterium]MBO6565128.1 acyl-CoA dehydrogenase [Pseudomonadales bacterium]MBO6594411.1 acyl-CoA dehydrogenase [Pseudomonadales bacterium]MBO6655587.1 acyl-CoA dehydrogenase [Pseudomonadales bacterium]MBO6700914.1 acyl-CoA dehydrogenase [Pseudomonadales bacterium]